MSTGYQINFTDSVNKGFIQVETNTVNNETSLSLPGRTKSDYGELVLENLLHLMENFANNNPPANPVEGQLWYDTTIGSDQLKVYDGTQFISTSGIKRTNSQPLSSESKLGDLWVNTATQQLFLYNGNIWSLIGPDTSPDIIQDTTNVSRVVATTFVNNKRLLIVSNEEVEFRPKSAIPGFDIIKPGVNILTGLKYHGTTVASENLIVPGEGTVLASNFARRDKDNSFIRPIRIQNNGGISIGETPTLRVAIAGNSNAVFRNLASGGNIQFQLTNNNFANPVLTLLSNGNVGVNKTNPGQALDVVGNAKISDKIFIGDIPGDLSQLLHSLTVAGSAEIRTDLNVIGNTSVNNIQLKDIVPDENNIRNIGTSNLRFSNIFAQTIDAPIINGTTLTGTLNGTADNAIRLTTDTNFQIIGAVSSSVKTFGGDGNVGNDVIFETEIDPAFITNQDITTSVNQLDPADNQTIFDEILINRPGVGLRKINQNVLVSTVPTIPVGMISPYGGDVAPLGWLICDGSLKDTIEFELLFTVIQYKFDPQLTFTGTDKFRLPDLRGRVPLGNTVMGSNEAADLSTVVNTGQLGAVGGSKDTVIEINNLPEHQHTLAGANGTKFYASTNISNTGENTVDPQAPNMRGDLPSSSVAQTGGVLGLPAEQSALSVINPYQAVNYIIYTGVLT